MRLVHGIKAVFGVDLPIESLFGAAATVCRMAGAIEAARRNSTISRQERK